jgi:hypothetical protein
LADHVFDLPGVSLLQIPLAKLQCQLGLEERGRIGSITRVTGDNAKRNLVLFQVDNDLQWIHLLARLKIAGGVFKHCCAHSTGGMKVTILKLCRAKRQTIPGDTEDSAFLNDEHGARLQNLNPTGVRAQFDRFVLCS